MSKRSQEKRRARAKEKAKRARRERGMSPLSRLAENEAAIECWLHYAATDDRMVNLTVFRPVRGGQTAAAFFLIDFDCIGLKDAFYRLDVVPGDVVENYRERSRQTGTRFVKGDLAEVRRMLGGAVRWTMEQRFRLPADTQRSLKIIGEVVAEGADITRFGAKGGGLYYVGGLRDLEKKLIDQTLEEFMARDDVKVLFMDDADAFMDDEDLEEDEEEFDEEELEEDELEEGMIRLTRETAKRMARDMRRWCVENGREVPDLLEDAALMQVATSLASLRATSREEQEAILKTKQEDMIAEYSGSDADRKTLRETHRLVVEYLGTLPADADATVDEVADDALSDEQTQPRVAPPSADGDRP